MLKRAGLIALAVVAVAGGLYAAMERERDIAVARASMELSAVMANRTAMAALGAPEALTGQSLRVGDVDLFERTWTIWFALGQNHAFVVSLRAPNGIAFVPLFNSRSGLELVAVDYLPVQEAN